MLLTPVLVAQNSTPAARAVRLSYVEGQVQISQGNQILASPALANTPLFEGTEVSAGDDGRAEIQFEDGSIARLSPNSSLLLSVLRQGGDGNQTEVVFEHGLGYFEAQSSGPTQTRIRFGNSVVTPSGFTVMRINLDNPPGELAVFSGNAHVDLGGSLPLDLHSGESLAATPSDPSGYNQTESIEPDSWDAWNADRDKALQSEYTAQTGASQNLGGGANPAWADLDANGNWYNVPNQGYVWSPYDALNNPGWDPYGNGNWMWTPGYGYIWVSGDSWGYLPFSCGNWNFYGGFGWGWAPGAGYCSPWWGTGSGWVSRVGFGPPGYRFPYRPRPRPRPVQPGVNLRPGSKLTAAPLIAVNHRPPSMQLAPAQELKGTVAKIGGHPVQPMRSLGPRPQPSQASGGFVTYPASAYQGRHSDEGAPAARPASGFVPGRSAYVPSTHPSAPPAYTPRPVVPSYAPSRPAAPIMRSAPPPPPRPSAPPPAPAAHSGGNGGAAPHH